MKKINKDQSRLKNKTSTKTTTAKTTTTTTAKVFLIILSISISFTASTTATISSSFDTPNIPIDQLTCRPTGLIQDTTCDYETVDELNRKIHSQLSTAVQLPIFRYHKVDLYRECPFWTEEGLCGNRACAVSELDKEEIPAYWRSNELSDLRTTDSRKIPINLDDKCVVKEQNYCVLDGENGVPSNGVYVDLLANPERFTGYSGESAHRVWRAIYEENCFKVEEEKPTKAPFGVSPPPPSPFAGLKSKPKDESRREESCLEKRAYYRLLSGLHTSISMHICDEYLDPASGKWVPNLQCYLNRIGLHPQRLKNLYFAYTLMLRALSRSSSYINSSRVELCTGDEEVDERTRRVLDQLTKTAHSYPVTFDETKMFKSRSAKLSNLKEEFKQHFRNVSRIMDCVGCDKCRLWGKLQVMGLGTALKLLFEYEDEPEKSSNFHLTRPELLAFINTLHRLSESLEAVEKFRKLWEQRSQEGTLPIQVVDERFDALASGKAAKAISLNSGLGPRANEGISNGVATTLSFGKINEKEVGVEKQEPGEEEKSGKVEEKGDKEEESLGLGKTKTVRTDFASNIRNQPSSVMNHRSTPSQAALVTTQTVNEDEDQKNQNLVQPNRLAYGQEPMKTKDGKPNGRSTSTGNSGGGGGGKNQSTEDEGLVGRRRKLRNANIREVVLIVDSFRKPASRLMRMFREKCLESISVCNHWLGELVGQFKTMVVPRHHHHHHDDGHEGGGAGGGGGGREVIVGEGISLSEKRRFEFDEVSSSGGGKIHKNKKDRSGREDL